MRALCEHPDAFADHKPPICAGCGLSLGEHGEAELIGESDEIDLPEFRPFVRRHRRFAMRCTGCCVKTPAEFPEAAMGTPLADVVACDETGVRIEGVNAHHGVFCSSGAVVHRAEFTRSKRAVENAMAGHRPDVWISDRYSAQQGHADQQQTCLAHLYRAARFVDENGEDDDLIAYRLKAWFARAFALNKGILDIAASTLKAKKRALKRDLKAILTTPTSSTLAHDLVAKIGRARNQLLTFCDHPGQVEPTNNQSERALRPSVIQRKVTNGYRAQWAADHEAAVRTALDTARLAGAGSFQTILNIVQA